MERQFDAVLTGSDSPIEGLVTTIDYSGYPQAYEFKSIDETLHLVIVQETDGHWIRVAGTEPYLTGWVDELVEQINHTSSIE
ncbi:MULTISPECIES: hypothetical protein [unclassified Mucilaginibacter]|uniref:hypothetical protein n=1 Tax=unclassified Mucilaginibacter TaxID=2617802 RepID=UPI0031F6F573